jgi:hypothetical protein
MGARHLDILHLKLDILRFQMSETQRSNTSAKTYYNVAIVCGVWFAFTGGLWAYLANAFVSFPVALIGLYFWRKARRFDPENKLNRAVKIIYIIGAGISVVILAALLMKN